MKMSDWLRWKKIAPLLAVTAIASTTFLTVELVSSDPSPPTPVDIDSTTPPPPPPDEINSEPPPLRLVTPTAVTVGGIEIPLPPGAHLVTVGPVEGPGTPPPNGPADRGIQKGDSYVLFSEKGLVYSKILPQDEADFAPVLLLLEKVSETTR